MENPTDAKRAEKLANWMSKEDQKAPQLVFLSEKAMVLVIQLANQSVQEMAVGSLESLLENRKDRGSTLVLVCRSAVLTVMVKGPWCL